MNLNKPLPPNAPGSNVQTPWPRDPGINPVEYLSGICAWPGLPSTALLKPCVTPADGKAMRGFLDRQAAAVKVRDENDIPSVLDAAAKLGRENNPHSTCEAEGLRRKASTLSIDDYHAGCAEVVAVNRESRAWAADWCERAAEKLWRVFDAEAEQVEARIIRLGGTMVTTRIVEGYSRDFWAPHTDVLLCGLFHSIWALAFYFPAEYREPKYFPGSPLGLFSDLTTD